MQEPNLVSQLSPEKRVAFAMAVPVLLMVIVAYFCLQSVLRVETLVVREYGPMLQEMKKNVPSPEGASDGAARIQGFEEIFAANIARIKTVLVMSSAVGIAISFLVGIIVTRSIAAELPGRSDPSSFRTGF